MANSGMNPIIYAWKNTNFRRAFSRLLKCKGPDSVDPMHSMRSNLHRKSSSLHHQDTLNGSLPNYSTPPPLHKSARSNTIEENTLDISIAIDNSQKIIIQDEKNKISVDDDNNKIVGGGDCNSGAKNDDDVCDNGVVIVSIGSIEQNSPMRKRKVPVTLNVKQQQQNINNEITMGNIIINKCAIIENFENIKNEHGIFGHKYNLAEIDKSPQIIPKPIECVINEQNDTIIYKINLVNDEK